MPNNRQNITIKKSVLIAKSAKDISHRKKLDSSRILKSGSSDAILAGKKTPFGAIHSIWFLGLTPSVYN